jgi:hypothetical protein
MLKLRGSVLREGLSCEEHRIVDWDFIIAQLPIPSTAKPALDINVTILGPFPAARDSLSGQHLPPQLRKSTTCPLVIQRHVKSNARSARSTPISSLPPLQSATLRFCLPSPPVSPFRNRKSKSLSPERGNDVLHGQTKPHHVRKWIGTEPTVEQGTHLFSISQCNAIRWQ